MDYLYFSPADEGGTDTSFEEFCWLVLKLAYKALALTCTEQKKSFNEKDVCSFVLVVNNQ